jgi:phosphoadenosine phosphosulfate reductase
MKTQSVMSLNGSKERTATELSQELESLTAAKRIKYLAEVYGQRLVASTSFGLQAAAMLHLIRENAPQIPIIFVDTGYCFPETYAFAQKLIDDWGLDIRVFNPTLSAARQEALYGKLWEQGDEGLKKYSLMNKVEPMNRALAEIGGDVWLSGLRRSQSTTRASREFAEQQRTTMKVYPILDWADAQLASYYYEHQLPKHPLESKGYVTMGDWHSTRLPHLGESAESTRFGGNKYECGLHEESGQNDFQI